MRMILVCETRRIEDGFSECFRNIIVSLANRIEQTNKAV